MESLYCSLEDVIHKKCAEVYRLETWLAILEIRDSQLSMPHISLFKDEINSAPLCLIPNLEILLIRPQHKASIV